MANTTWSSSDKTAAITLSGTNNVVMTTTGTGPNAIRTIDRQITGKFYLEMTMTTIAGTGIACGLANQAAVLGNLSQTAGTSVNAAWVNSAGTVCVNGATGPTLGAFSNGGVACIAIDIDGQSVWFRNGAAGNWNASATNNPATGVGGIAAPMFGKAIPVYGLATASGASNIVVTANFGDVAFAGTPPAGFTAGFTAGATPTLYAVNTQASVEQWSAGSPAAQATQLALEEWATVAVGNVQALATQVSLEMWASVAQQAIVTGSSPGFVVIMA